MDLMNFYYRTETMPFRELFHRFDPEDARCHFSHLAADNPHQTVLNVIRHMWEGGYDYVLDTYGFWDTHHVAFSGHCHQMTPVLAIPLVALGFKDVAYLECYRISKEKFEQKELVEKIDPREEPNPDMRDEFCSIGRIPYCCLELRIGDHLYYLSGKHVKLDGDVLKPILTPDCHAEFTGVLRHPQDSTKSGIYLRTTPPKGQPDRVIWYKQGPKDIEAELFATFLRMKLEL
ncbi:MAG TPA: hypothetical protein VJG90_04375 [Candidatus Nanoarchaeia archaeon]|nr:hypothetical protein [Candidatus Nanoarchaeia archaeon]